MNPFENTPFVDFSDLIAPDFDVTTLSDDDLASFLADLDASIQDVAGNPSEHVTAEFTTAQLMDVTKLAVGLRDGLVSETARRAEVAKAAAAADEFAALAAKKDDDDKPDDDPEKPDDTPDGDAAANTDGATVDAVTAGAMPKPGAGREIEEHQERRRTIALVAAGGARDMTPGTPFGSELDLADAMIKRHRQFGDGGPEVHEQFAIAMADWKDEYPADRLLGKDEETNWDKIGVITASAAIRREFDARLRQQDKEFAIVASGGLCAPVTPYYNLQFISTPARPVMAGLPSFVADRGGLRYARPAALSAVTTAVGLITAAQDAVPSTATKTCQVIPCPAFTETDVSVIYHCLQFGNLGARTFPELVAQWNNLVLAAHARLAESNLLTQIDTNSTQVTAGHLGLGASASLFSQILTAANGLRSRNRMDPNAVLRLMLPIWAVDLIISDVIRSQFERFDTDEAQVTALLRSFDIEPSFYIDGANGKSQVYGTQSAGALLPFPATVTWYLFPEGSFLFLDGGTLELGIVRDSVLNATNDFQIFGETFENLAFIGVESLAVTSTVCDSGTVSLPAAVTCPITYAGS